jgi:hypothetical protein
MTLDPADRKFVAETLPAVEGWLLDDSAFLTSSLIRWQTEMGTPGGIFEVGVFAGKYLSLLYHLTQGTDKPVLGLDTFQWYPRENVEKNFARVFGSPHRLTLTTADSTQVTAGDVVEKLGGKPMFISVDGAHTAPAVLHDLLLSEQILTDGGIVAIDDVLNPRAIGVGEGAYRYFLTRERKGLTPFAYCANKLYACHRHEAGRFSQAVWQFTRDNPGLKVADDFNDLLAKGRAWVEQDLFGLPVVVL